MIRARVANGPVSSPISPSPAATVLVVRGGTDALEVLLLRRRPDSGFVPGAYVFPGGAVDPADHQSDVHGCTDGPDDRTASWQLGLASGGLGHRVAAVRECFEEAGILFAATPRGPVEAEVVSGLQDQRHALDSGHTDIAVLCSSNQLTLSTAQLRPFAHWVTPAGPPRRYDTRFFLALAPEGQVATPDGTEVVDACWLAPSDALARSSGGKLPLIQPTRRSLEALACFDSAGALLAAMDATLEVGVQAVDDRGGRRLALTESERARAVALEGSAA